MKVVLTFKTPDVTDQMDDLNEDQVREAKKKLEKWLEYDECVSIEFDLEATTARVLTR